MCVDTSEASVSMKAVFCAVGVFKQPFKSYSLIYSCCCLSKGVFCTRLVDAVPSAAIFLLEQTMFLDHSGRRIKKEYKKKGETFSIGFFGVVFFLLFFCFGLGFFVVLLLLLFFLI